MFITEWEVKKYSTLGDDFPLDKISAIMDTTEKDTMRTYFGNTFRNVLFNDLKVDSNVYVKWNPTTTWAQNATVIHYGVRWIAENNNTNKTPGTTSDWTLYEIFNESKYQDLWVRHLRSYLAFACAIQALPFATVQANGNGLTMQAADSRTNQYTATHGMYGLYNQAMIRQMDAIGINMREWILDAHKTYTNSQDSVFQDIDFIDSACGDVGQRARRPHTIFFRN